MALPVKPRDFSRRLRRGAKAENAALTFLRRAGHEPMPIGFAASTRLDFSTDEAQRQSHRRPDLRCSRCGLLFEIRSARVGMTMARSRYPFWQDKPLDHTYVIHVNVSKQTFMVVTMRDLARTRLKAQVRTDRERGYPYFYWAPELLGPMLRSLPRCNRPESRKRERVQQARMI